MDRERSAKTASADRKWLSTKTVRWHRPFSSFGRARTYTLHDGVLIVSDTQTIKIRGEGVLRAWSKTGGKLPKCGDGLTRLLMA